MTKKLYICSPLKNKECRKTGCMYLFNGECFCTTNEQHATTGPNGEPIEVDLSVYDETEKRVRSIIENTFAEKLDQAILGELSE